MASKIDAALEALNTAAKQYHAATGRGVVFLTPEPGGSQYDAVYQGLPDDEQVANMLDGELQRVRKAGRLARVAHA